MMLQERAYLEIQKYTEEKDEKEENKFLNLRHIPDKTKDKIIHN